MAHNEEDSAAAQKVADCAGGVVKFSRPTCASDGHSGKYALTGLMVGGTRNPCTRMVDGSKTLQCGQAGGL